MKEWLSRWWKRIRDGALPHPIPSLSYAPKPHIPAPSTLTGPEIDYIALLDVDEYEPLGLWEMLETFQQLRPDFEEPVAVVREAVCRLLGRRLIGVYICRRFPQPDSPLPIDEAIKVLNSASAWVKPDDLRFVRVELELTVAGKRLLDRQDFPSLSQKRRQELASAWWYGYW